jgi:hypothetical protein
MDKDGHLLSAILCFVLMGLFLLACGTSTGEGPVSKFTFRDMDDGTTLISHKGCANCAQDFSFVITWETRTVCEMITSDVECWVSVVPLEEVEEP